MQSGEAARSSPIRERLVPSLREATRTLRAIAQRRNERSPGGLAAGYRRGTENTERKILKVGLLSIVDLTDY
jgi:hypothetical protein